MPALIEEIKQRPSWINGELNSMILLKSTEKQIVLTALHKGTKIVSFQSRESINIKIIEGEMKAHTRNQNILLHIGQELTLYDKIKFSLIAMRESVFLLTSTDGNLYSGV
jgi:hypothetical protein